MTNKYDGTCRKCGKRVDAGEGVLTGPPWTTWCCCCAPALAAASAVQTSCSVISVRCYGGTSASVAPSGRLGDSWSKYKDTCDAYGARYQKAAGAQVVRLEDLPALLLALREAAFTLDVDASLQQALVCKSSQSSADVAAAIDRAVAVDAELRSRGLFLYPFQRDGVAWLAPRFSALLADAMGLGKGQPIGAKVLAPSGWRVIGDLRVGDDIVGRDGRATRVTGVFPRGRLPVYRVKFMDGSTLRVDGDHLWAAWEHSDYHRGKNYRVVETRDLIGHLRDGAGNCRWRIPLCAPVEFASGADLPIDPYLLGVLLGDQGRAKAAINFCPGDDLVPAEVAKVLPAGTVMNRKTSCGRAASYSITSSPKFSANPVAAVLRRLGLQGLYSYERFIPQQYLLASVEDRLSLLQGLMDTDGEVRPKDNHVEFTSTSQRLADGVEFLVESLGGTVRRHLRAKPQYTHKGEKRTGRPSHRLTICLGGMNPFRAFASRYHDRPKYPPTRSIDSIKPDGVEDVVCIAVDAPDHLYVTEHFIVTHNTLTALIAAPAGAPILVICPAVAKGVWARETAKWRPDLKSAALSGRGSFRWPVAGEVLATNFDILPPTTVETNGEKRPADFLASCPAGIVLVVDECHAIKSAQAQRTERVKAIAAAVRGVGGRTWFLTGTPLLNRPPELWSVLRGLGSAEALFGSFFRFASATGGSQREIKAQGGRRVTVWEWNSHGVRPEVASTLKKIMLRRLKEEVLHDLPPKTRQDIPVELDSATARLCDAALEAIAKRGMTIEQAVAHATGCGSVEFEQISRARAALATAKMGALLDLVESYEEAGEPVVVFSAHRAPIDALAVREGWATITGETAPEERTRIEDRFQRGELRGVGATIKAGGVAVTLHRASHAIFVDLDWTPALNLQAEDRIWRIGTKKAVLIQRLVADHVLDMRIAVLLAEKQEMVNKTIDAAARHEGDKVSETDHITALLAVLSEQGDALQAARAAQETMTVVLAAADAEMAALLAEVETEEKAREAARDEKAAWNALSSQEKKERAFTRLVERAKARRKNMIAGQQVRPAKNPIETWAADGLVSLAEADADFAQELNEVGFSKAVTGIGHAFADAVRADGLTDVEWRQAVGICKAYRRQVGEPPKVEEM
jgi:hypothetical protein